MPGSVAPKRPYNIDPEVARERARRGGYARNTPDSHIRSLAAVTLTVAQKRRLAALLMPFLDDDDSAAAGAGTR